MQAGCAHKETSLNFDVLCQKELTIIGGLGQSGDVEEAVKIINSRRFTVEKIITHKFALQDAKKAMEFFIEGRPECIRVGIVCNESF